jgi:MFS family permease
VFLKEGDMDHINWRRVIIGGLLCGLVINVFEFLLNSVLLREDWRAALRALGRPEQLGAGQMAAFVVWGFLVGTFAVWLYAELRPYYGAGPKTAAIAGVSVWFLGYLLAAVAPLVMQLFPERLMLIGLAVGLAEAVVGTIAGAWVYRSVTARDASSAAARA